MSEADKLPLPIIDLQSPSIVEDLRAACSQVGFFYLKNHSVSKELWDNTFQATRNFFNLPLEEKLKVEVGANHRGYTKYLDETLDVDNQTMGDTKEGYYIGRESDSPLPLHGLNKYPDESVIPGWKTQVDNYFQALWKLGDQLLVPLAKAVGCEENFFLDRFSNPMIFLRLLHYSAHQSRPDSGIFGAGAHTDFGMLTLLATDEVPGLQIFTQYQPSQSDDGKIMLIKQDQPSWIDVPPIPYVFVVNLGDMLERWTNGFFKSTLHRVVNFSGKERYSIPFFYEPNFDTYVEPLAQFVTPESASKYTPTTSGQHLLDCYERTSVAYVEKKNE